MYKIPTNTLFIGKKLFFVPRCHSTNTLTNTMSKDHHVVDGTVVITDHQFAGRGQQGRAWITDAGKNLTFSILLKPTFLSTKDQFLLNAAISLGVHGYLKQLFSEGINIKWPNDILLKGTKICGLLLENQVQSHHFVRSIVGVGLNVNQTIFHGVTASSLRLIAGRTFDLSEVLASLLGWIEDYYIMLRQGHYSAIKDQYTTALFGIGEKCVFEMDSRHVAGVVRGVDDWGCLLVEMENRILAFQAGEIKLVL